jgi:hypothetical protein
VASSGCGTVPLAPDRLKAGKAAICLFLLLFAAFWIGNEDAPPENDPTSIREMPKP